MNLDDFLRTISTSTPAEWHKLHIPVVAGWDYGSLANGSRYLEPKTHHEIAVYKPDIDISIASGATAVEDFGEPWVTNFPDPHATSILQWFRWRGEAVYQVVSVVVDGGRYTLPLPQVDDKGRYYVSQDSLPLARLLFDLAGAGGAHQTIESALGRAKIAIV